MRYLHDGVATRSIVWVEGRPHLAVCPRFSIFQSLDWRGHSLGYCAPAVYG